MPFVRFSAAAGFIIFQQLITATALKFDSFYLDDRNIHKLTEVIPPQFQEFRQIFYHAQKLLKRKKSRSRVYDLILSSLAFQVLITCTKLFLYFTPIGLVDQNSHQITHRFKLAVLCLLYTAVNLSICHKFVYLDKLGYLVKDGLLLPLILSIYLYDAVTINVIATCFPVVLALFNVGLVREIYLRTTKPQSASKREMLIDLIGKHDSIYMYALSSATLGVLGCFDTLFRTSLFHFINSAYYCFSAYQTSHTLMTD